MKKEVQSALGGWECPPGFPLLTGAGLRCWKYDVNIPGLKINQLTSYFCYVIITSQGETDAS